MIAIGEPSFKRVHIYIQTGNTWPTSSVAAIDQAVTKSHTHANKAVLDNLTFNEAAGGLLYSTVPVGTVFGTVAW